MYYLAFFLHYPSFVEEKIKVFLHENLSDVWFHYEGRENLLEKIPWNLEDYWESLYGRNWHIYSPHTNECNKEDYWNSLPSFDAASLEQVNIILRWLSERYLWSIFPWGGATIPFLSFGFLSRDRSLRDRFLNATPNTADINTKGLGLKFGSYNIPQSNLLISKYDVAGDFSDLARVILFSEFEEAGMAVWDACGCDAAKPFLIGDLYIPEPENLEQTEAESYEPDFLKEQEFDLVRIMEIFTEEKHTNPYQFGVPLELGVVRPRNRKSFLSMCRCDLSSDADTEIVVPQDTDFELLQSLLAKIEANRDYSTYSDLSHLGELLETMQWFYGLNRDSGIQKYSLFASKQNTLLKRVAINLGASKNSQLISCF